VIFTFLELQDTAIHLFQIGSVCNRMLTKSERSICLFSGNICTYVDRNVLTSSRQLRIITPRCIFIQGCMYAVFEDSCACWSNVRLHLHCKPLLTWPMTHARDEHASRSWDTTHVDVRLGWDTQTSPLTPTLRHNVAHWLNSEPPDCAPSLPLGMPKEPTFHD
jgi:hypothetical protein